MNGFRKSYGRRANGTATFFAVVAVFVFTVILFLCVFFWYGRAYARVSLDKTYYFLVRDCEETTAAAVSGQVYFSGGAGYLLGSGGDSAVVLACYFKQTDAEYVQANMTDKGVDTQVLALSSSDFTLDGGNSEQKSRIAANAETVETCAHILYDAANGLERTDISQDEARAAVRGVVVSLKGLYTENDGSFYDLWNAGLSGAAKRGTEIAEGIAFAKDLRYLQVELCLMIVNAANYFS